MTPTKFSSLSMTGAPVKPCSRKSFARSRRSIVSGTQTTLLDMISRAVTPMVVPSDPKRPGGRQGTPDSPRRPGSNPTGSTFEHAERHQPRDLAREACPLDDVDDLGDVLVGLRHLLGDGGEPGGADDDAALLELPQDRSALRGALGGGSAHDPARAVARRPEAPCHRS